MAKRKPRWWVRALGVVVVLGLLAGAAEIALRMIIPNIVAGTIRSELKLSDDHPVDVELGGSTLVNAVRGGVGDVTITSPEVPLIEGLIADARVHADFTPFDPTTGEIVGGTAALTVPKNELGPTIELLTQGIAQSGEVRGDELVVGRSVEIFGQDVSITASLRVGVEDGEVTVEPMGLKAAGFDMSAKQLGSVTGSLLEPILKPQQLCVADRLPKGIELSSVDLSSTGSVTIRADLSPTILAVAREQEPGSCE
ncbi:hypothetical protein JOF28_000901 [Leucobacter exalbidus]|uniref:DUF2993 domain-containing protein n=1 Tax=Leucobacter exalbidus TaxID=662960 RepID=A0A940PQC7_9MICO|nr:DUF2993 domain-containing protein [Leucobacter exalbidus]MBP1325669.1 hypothetical protein [Leucobacter exalbidus]